MNLRSTQKPPHFILLRFSKSLDFIKEIPNEFEVDTENPLLHFISGSPAAGRRCRSWNKVLGKNLSPRRTDGRRRRTKNHPPNHGRSIFILVLFYRFWIHVKFFRGSRFFCFMWNMIFGKLYNDQIYIVNYEVSFVWKMDLGSRTSQF